MARLGDDGQQEKVKLTIDYVVEKLVADSVIASMPLRFIWILQVSYDDVRSERSSLR